MRIDRPLNYEIENRMQYLEEAGMDFPSNTNVSQGIDADSKNRIWALTFNKQPAEKGSLSSTLTDKEILEFQIFDSTGRLLGSIPTPQLITNFRIFDDRLFIIDTFFDMSVYEYKIVEK